MVRRVERGSVGGVGGQRIVRGDGVGLDRVGGAAVLAVVGAMLAMTGAAATGSTAESKADKVGAVLSTHCARCHQTGKVENPPAKGAIANILDLTALAGRDDLVVPGDPDASRLYQLLLSRHRPHTVFFGPVPGPSAAEIQDVRDWIAGLPPRGEACPDRVVVTPADIARDAAAWRKAFETDAGKPLRFITLAALSNLCRDDRTLAGYRMAVAMLLARLSGKAAPQLDTVGEASVLLAFRPDEIGLTAEAWDLRAGHGDDVPAVVDADALASRALAAGAPGLAAGMPLSPVGRAVAAPLEDGQIDPHIAGIDPVEALASEYRRTVTVQRAAAELAIPPAALRETLLGLGGAQKPLALRLAATGLPRREWSTLKAALAGRTAPGAGAAAGPELEDARLTLALWTDATGYKAGDLLTVHVRPSADCNLTLVAIESDGLATVLFPNDTVLDNRVTGGSEVQVPPAGAPFQLRLDKPGRQGIVGICHASAKRPEGIGHDFERQRFTVLGDWRTFLATTAEREAAYQKTQDDLRKFRTGAGKAETLGEQLPVGTEDEARAGLSFEVRP